jgi:hypothetical protein
MLLPVKERNGVRYADEPSGTAPRDLFDWLTRGFLTP